MAKNKSFTESQAVALEKFQTLAQSGDLRLVEVKKIGKDAISYGVASSADELLAIIPTQDQYELYDPGVLAQASSDDE